MFSCNPNSYYVSHEFPSLKNRTASKDINLTYKAVTLLLLNYTMQCCTSATKRTASKHIQSIDL